MEYFDLNLRPSELKHFTIQDANNRYIYMSGTYNSFNVSDSRPESGYLWTAVANEDGTVKLMNVEKSKYISYDESYSSFGAYAEPTNNQKAALTLVTYVAPVPGGNEGDGSGDAEGGQTEQSGIKDGTYVIWAPAYNKALSANYGNSYYNPGVDVTESGNTISGYGSTEVWTVTKKENGNYTISYNGKNIGMGTQYSSMPLGGVNDEWTLEAAGNGLYYVKNVGRNVYMEWYVENNYWSGYGTIAEGSEGMFALKFTPVAAPAKAAAPAASAGAGSIRIEAGAAGKVFKLEKKVGDKVEKGDAVLILEAMKMEIPVVAPEAGTVASIDVAVGDTVESGALLATLN